MMIRGQPGIKKIRTKVHSVGVDLLLEVAEIENNLPCGKKRTCMK